jgi:hypothetical protein
MQTHMPNFVKYFIFAAILLYFQDILASHPQNSVATCDINVFLPKHDYGEAVFLSGFLEND